MDDPVAELRAELEWMRYDRLVRINERHNLHLKIAQLEREISQLRQSAAIAAAAGHKSYSLK